MAIKNIIAMGIGFTPGSVQFIPTHGFSSLDVQDGPWCVTDYTVFVPGDDRRVVFVPGDDRRTAFVPGDDRRVVTCQ